MNADELIRAREKMKIALAKPVEPSGVYIDLRALLSRSEIKTKNSKHDTKRN